jgi:hypothetical protein
MVMGSVEDPKDGAVVASSIFLAVAVYGVHQLSSRNKQDDNKLMTAVGFPSLLRLPSVSTHPAEQAGSDIFAVKAEPGGRLKGLRSNPAICLYHLWRMVPED